MNRADQWFSRHTQQAVMSRVAVLPTIAKTGPSSRATTVEPTKTINPGENVFIVGESEVGGQNRVGGTP